MSLLFTAGRIGTLELPNRLVRSATAERLADDDGRPTPRLNQLYQRLVQGGVGLIISGHLYVHPSGKAHPEMTGIYADELIPSLAELTAAVHQEGGRVVAQINHGGMQCSAETVSETLAPSAVDAPFLQQPAREIKPDEITDLIDAYSQAARRAKEAGFDGVQIHGAHGYLISQFLSSYINRRSDEWGGDTQRRMRFLRSLCQAIREQVGSQYPVFVKLGLVDGIEGGLTLEEGVQVVAALEEAGLDGVEVSSGVQASSIRPNPKEAYFRPLARAARPVTRLPILLVGGLRSRAQMEEVLASGDADFVSLCRPLICEPDLPNKMRQGVQERARCISGNRCWPTKTGEGITCKHLKESQKTALDEKLHDCQ
jgi:2,4-dienoyl-CoA reductase-like NADH-dependent reductase (Old Yellow Enzyme family)